MAKRVPVYNIKAFGEHNTPEFYSNILEKHVASHTFTNLPHKHDFYLVMLITQGSGTHEIDFTTYKVSPGSVFIMKPGQMHYWKLSKDIRGYVFFHSKSFFEEGFTGIQLRDYPFYRSFQYSPYTKLSLTATKELEVRMKEINEEVKQHKVFKMQSVQLLMSLAYISISRHYKAKQSSGKETYLSKAIEFEASIDNNFKELRSASDYASLLNISEKHLNRITRVCFNKTSTQLIAERIVLEAKRLLIHTGQQVTQVAYELGYNDKSYFVRFFKKNAGETPLSFLQRYKQN
jgi:AraC-like DNA-binding protein